MDDKPIKAWCRPSGWNPKHPCEECEGTGMGNHKTFHNDELVDWDDCEHCEGTGESKPPARAGKGGRNAKG